MNYIYAILLITFIGIFPIESIFSFSRQKPLSNQLVIIELEPFEKLLTGILYFSKGIFSLAIWKNLAGNDYIYIAPFILLFFEINIRPNNL